MGTPAPDAVKRLVDHFDQNRKVFLSGDYKEEQLRAEFGQRTCRLRFLNPFYTELGWDMDNKQGLSEFSVIANSVHSSRSIVPGTEDRKPGTKNREPKTDGVIRLTDGHQAKVERRTKGPVPTRALDGPSAPRKLYAMPCEPRPDLTEVELSPELPRR